MTELDAPGSDGPDSPDVLDVANVRARYPALADGWAYLDGAAGTQLPASVIDAIADAYRAGLGNQGGPFAASGRSDRLVAECRRAVADLVGGQPDGVVIGPNMTTLTYRLAETISRNWAQGDEIVLSRLDHDANVRPWVQAATASGATVRWAEFDPATGELPVEQYDQLLGDRTRLVAVTAASNVLGTRPDVPAITARAHAAGALTFVDGVHATPHGPVDVAALGADLYATSSYKWSGPHAGFVIADPAVLERLRPYKLAPAPATGPDRFERGTHAFADLAGVIAAVEHLAALAPGSATTRRSRVLASMAAAAAYEERLFTGLLRRMSRLDGVKLYGDPARRTATAYFDVEDLSPRRVAEAMAAAKVNVWSGTNYAWEVARVLGIQESGGAVRVGLVHYNDESDVARFLDVLGRLVAGDA